MNVLITGASGGIGYELAKLFARVITTAEKVARGGYRGLMAGRTVAISCAHNWLLAQSVRFAPRKLVTPISRWVAEEVQ